MAVSNEKAEQTIDCNGVEIQLVGETGPFTPSLTCERIREGVFDVVLQLAADAEAQLPEVVLAWQLPYVDFHHKWNSECMLNRALDVGRATANFVTGRANRQAPVYSLYDLEGVNTCTFAMSDAVHDFRLGGVWDGDNIYSCKATIDSPKVDPTDQYELTLRFDFRRIPYDRSLQDIVTWWAAMPRYAPCPIPDAARLPLLSSWYAYVMDLDRDDLFMQCERAKDMGFDVVILDDGWQTEQLTHGYENNGDWEVSTKKFPDMAGYVKRVQDLGMKFMVWFSVPFVGVDSKAYHTMRQYLLPGREGAKWFGLDPRFPEVRQYLADIYERFVKTYGVDGLKLDFIGSIGGRPEDETARKPGHDTASIGVGVCRLLDDVTQRLRAVNPEILFEFRQAYIGPAMRKYGNMFRAVDCPNSIGDNRVRTLDVRLLAGDTSVHSDPITWHRDDPNESAAMQLIHALFSVPQISMKMSDLVPGHAQMLRSYLKFWREYRDVLLQGDLRPMYPHLLYPLVIASDQSRCVAAFYGPMPLVCNDDLQDTLILVNGTYQKQLIIDARADLGTYSVTTTDCLGNVEQHEPICLTRGLHQVAVPAAGHAVLKKQ